MPSFLKNLFCCCSSSQRSELPPNLPRDSSASLRTYRESTTVPDSITVRSSTTVRASTVRSSAVRSSTIAHRPGSHMSFDVLMKSKNTESTEQPFSQRRATLISLGQQKRDPSHGSIPISPTFPVSKNAVLPAQNSPISLRGLFNPSEELLPPYTTELRTGVNFFENELSTSSSSIVSTPLPYDPQKGPFHKSTQTPPLEMFPYTISRIIIAHGGPELPRGVIARSIIERQTGFVYQLPADSTKDQKSKETLQTAQPPEEMSTLLHEPPKNEKILNVQEDFEVLPTAQGALSYGPSASDTEAADLDTTEHNNCRQDASMKRTFPEGGTSLLSQASLPDAATSPSRDDHEDKLSSAGSLISNQSSDSEDTISVIQSMTSTFHIVESPWRENRADSGLNFSVVVGDPPSGESAPAGQHLQLPVLSPAESDSLSPVIFEPISDSPSDSP